MVDSWATHLEQGLEVWTGMGNENDRKPIINSPLFGLVDSTDGTAAVEEAD